MRKIREILRLKYGAGLTDRQVAASVAVSRSTVQVEARSGIEPLYAALQAAA
jgi:DNA-directed RNA polymerase specialized sigma24 family protein